MHRHYCELYRPITSYQFAVVQHVLFYVLEKYLTLLLDICFPFSTMCDKLLAYSSELCPTLPLGNLISASLA